MRSFFVVRKKIEEGKKKGKLSTNQIRVFNLIKARYVRTTIKGTIMKKRTSSIGNRENK